MVDDQNDLPRVRVWGTRGHTKPLINHAHNHRSWCYAFPGFMPMCVLSWLKQNTCWGGMSWLPLIYRSHPLIQPPIHQSLSAVHDLSHPLRATAHQTASPTTIASSSYSPHQDWFSVLWSLFIWPGIWPHHLLFLVQLNNWTINQGTEVVNAYTWLYRIHCSKQFGLLSIP